MTFLLVLVGSAMVGAGVLVHDAAGAFVAGCGVFVAALAAEGRKR